MGADNILGLSDITDNSRIWRMLLAEFIGTFFLVFLGCASIITFPDGGTAKLIQVSLTFGLTVASLVQCLGRVSGCHINPAVTLSMFCTGDVKLLKALCFVFVQCLGAAAGSAVLELAVPYKFHGTLGATALGEGVTDVMGFLTEAVLTFIFLFVIHACCDPRNKDTKSTAALSIGLTLTICHLAAIPITGSSLNPARTFGPAVLKNNWDDHWVYWVGPILGGAIAGLAHKFIFNVQKSDEESYDFS